MAIENLGIFERSAVNAKGKRSYTHVYKLNVTTAAEATEWQVGSAAGLPRIGQKHSEDSNAYCTSLDVKMATKFAEWHVTATYEQNEWELRENPLFDAAAIDWDGEKYEEPLVVDVSGEAVLNSAGDPFFNLFRERSRRIVTVVKNVASVPPWILDSEDAVNSSAFTLDGLSIPAKKAKLEAPRISRVQRRNDIAFREMSMKITLNRDEWKSKPLQAGFRYRNGLGELVRILNDDYTDITQPACLQANGFVLSNPTPATAVFGDFDVYPAFDFNQLPLT